MSVRRPILAALLLISVTAIAGPLWAVFVYKFPPNALAGTTPGPRTLARFEAMAEEACRCKRAENGKPGSHCWDRFGRATAPYAPSEMVMACGVTGTEMICFGGNGTTPCFTIDRSANGECNAEERRVIEAIWTEGDRYYEDPAEQARAMAADRIAHEAFKRGDAAFLPRGAKTGGCGGRP